MAISRYWRLVGICTSGNEVLELSEARVYGAGALADTGATLTCTFAPASGALADLHDGAATGIVSWPYASYSTPGFALVWDFGSGGGVEFPSWLFGSGSSALTFPLDVIVQSSTNGVDWVAYYLPFVSLIYPGPASFTDTPTALSDPYFASTVLLLHCDGSNGSTIFTDRGSAPKTLLAYGNAQVSTAQSKWGGASVYFDGVGDYLETPVSDDFSFGAGDFTLETWFYISAFTYPAPHIIVINDGTGANEIRLAYDNVSKILKYILFHSGTYKFVLGGTTTLAIGQWYHAAAVRSGNNYLLFLNGMLEASASVVGAMPTVSWKLDMGAYPYGRENYYHTGYLDDIRISKGVARYTANFTPPVAAFPDFFLYPLVSYPVPHRTRHLIIISDRMLPATALADSTAHGHLREYPFFDSYNGGIGLIYGTVKEKSTLDAPLSRKVWLMDQNSGMVVREAWSDATTGDYEFRGIKQGVPYTVISFDYTGTYRAVIADNQIPELIT